MFGTINKRIVSAAVLAVGVMLTPGTASAVTPIPALPIGSTQAYASLNGATPITTPTVRAFTGPMKWTAGGGAGVSVTCTYSANYTIDPTGIGNVQGMTFTACTTNVPGFGASVVVAPSPNNIWGRRLVSWPGSLTGAPSARYDLINVAFQITFSGSGPFPPGVPFTQTGLVWFRGAPLLGGPATPTSATVPNNEVTSPLGAARLAWSPAINAGQPALFIL